MIELFDTDVSVFAEIWLSSCASRSATSLLVGLVLSLQFSILDSEFGPAKNICFYEGSVGIYRRALAEFTDPFQHEGSVAMPGGAGYLSILNSFPNDLIYPVLCNGVHHRNGIREEHRRLDSQLRSGD